MDTQNTQIHFKMWHWDFWRLCLANFLLMTSIYMFIVGVPYFLACDGYNHVQIGLTFVGYALGLFLMGGVNSYLVQRFRRNRVCLTAILGVAISQSILLYLDVFWNFKFGIEGLVLTRTLQGALLGLAQMTLTSTLVIDSCQSFQRTEANFWSSWFSKLSIGSGPLLAYLIYKSFGMVYIFPVASVLSLLAFVLVWRVKFPFKAPSEKLRVFSLDRFFLPQGTPLFINIVLITTAVGMYLVVPHSADIYFMILFGLLLGWIADKFVFAEADLKSEVIVGLILLLSAQFMSYSGQPFAMEALVPVLFGMGAGIMGSRFLLFYIKLARHCQRGTSTSSFFLAWELGMNLGIALTFFIMSHEFNPKLVDLDCPIINPVRDEVLRPAIALTAMALLVYHFLVHSWYMKHRNR